MIPEYFCCPVCSVPLYWRWVGSDEPRIATCPEWCWTEEWEEDEED